MRASMTPLALSGLSFLSHPQSDVGVGHHEGVAVILWEDEAKNLENWKARATRAEKQRSGPHYGFHRFLAIVAVVTAILLILLLFPREARASDKGDVCTPFECAAQGKHAHTICLISADKPDMIGQSATVRGRVELLCDGRKFLRSRMRVLMQMRLRTVEKRSLFGLDRLMPDKVTVEWITVDRGRDPSWNFKEYSKENGAVSCDLLRPTHQFRTQTLVEVDEKNGDHLKGRAYSESRKLPCNVSLSRLN